MAKPLTSLSVLENKFPMYWSITFLYVLFLQPHCLQVSAPDGQMRGRVDFFTDFDASGGQLFFGTVDVRGHNGQYVQGFFPYLEAGGRLFTAESYRSGHGRAWGAKFRNDSMSFSS